MASTANKWSKSECVSCRKTFFKHDRYATKKQLTGPNTLLKDHGCSEKA
jgi:hypothetical protein